MRYYCFILTKYFPLFIETSDKSRKRDDESKVVNPLVKKSINTEMVKKKTQQPQQKNSFLEYLTFHIIKLIQI